MNFEMSLVSESAPMAECLGFGLGLADNEDLKQSTMNPNGAMLHGVLFKYMDGIVKTRRNNKIPSQNEKKESMLFSNEGLEQKTSNSKNNVKSSLSIFEDKFAECSIESFDSPDDEGSEDEEEKSHVPSIDSTLYFLPLNYNKRNPWRRTIGLHIFGNELKSATYPARSSVKKLRFAQAKKPLNYLYSYFSVELLDCDDFSSITIGICRKDYPSKISPGKNSGSVGYNSDSGNVYIRDSVLLSGPRFSKGDIIGCGIIFPSHYKNYADLSTDDNSDGMTDVVLTSIANTNSKAMDFVCSVLNLSNAKYSSDEETQNPSNKSLANHFIDTEECDYYNDNFVESRTQVEVYFTQNMQVVGKVLSHVPVGGFYPTVHLHSHSAIKMNVDFNPPFS